MNNPNLPQNMLKFLFTICVHDDEVLRRPLFKHQELVRARRKSPPQYRELSQGKSSNVTHKMLIFLIELRPTEFC